MGLAHRGNGICNSDDPNGTNGCEVGDLHWIRGEIEPEDIELLNPAFGQRRKLW